MASIRSNYNAIVGTEKESKNTKVVCCMDCAWAHLIQYGNNPVLAECHKNPNPDNDKFPYERQVASTRWICPTWKHDASEKTIEKREHTAA